MSDIKFSSKSSKRCGIIMSAIPISIFVIQLLFILNWAFQITSFQKFQGMPLLLAPIVSAIGIISGIVTLRIYRSKVSLVGIIGNVVLFLALPIYWFWGALFFGV